MDIEVIGRHALLFDDDPTAEFVNSKEALVEWNSLLIDRFDVRHLLTSPLPPRMGGRDKLTRSSSPSLLPDGSLEADLDLERYLDLPPLSDDPVKGVDDNAGPASVGGYRAVAFSYGNPDESMEQKNSDADSVFQPPFPLPETLFKHLPPTEKIHQIIARTATFVAQHGGQSEIILRVKQGDNPTFGFLMPDHHLHAYFRFLVDNQELLKADGKSSGDNRADCKLDQTGGALSLLGSIYGSGEDDDGITEDAPESENQKSEVSLDAVKTNVSPRQEQMDCSGHGAQKDEAASNNHPLKEKVAVIKKNRSIGAVKGGTAAGTKKHGGLSGSTSTATHVSQASAMSSTSKGELPILEPLSDIKRTVEKIVEFVLKNGKEFEAILAEQDHNFGRFPFLIPSNQYHPYYLKVFQKAQECKLLGKDFFSEKDESVGHAMDKKTSLSKEGNPTSLGFADLEIPQDYDRKEKFKMVIGKSKKDGQDPSSRDNQPQTGVSMDADAAAAILRAATMGIKHPNLDMFPKTTSGSIDQVFPDESRRSASFGSLTTSQPQTSIRKPNGVGDASGSVPVSRIIAESAANEADSSEASLTREQKLKAERLKRAKMFAAIIKSGAAPLKAEPLRGLSTDPSGSGVSSSGIEVVSPAGRDREGSSAPVDDDAFLESEKSKRKASVDESNERRSKRSYRSRSNKQEDDESDDDEQDKEEENRAKRDHKHSRKSRSHRSSHHSRDRYKRRKKHSSKDENSRHHHNDDSCSSDEHRHSRYRQKGRISSDDEHWPSQKRHKYYSSSDDENNSRHKHKRIISSDEEQQSSRGHHKHEGSSDDDHHHARHHCKHHGSSSSKKHRRRSKSSKNRKSQSKKEVELEEGEICAKSDQSKVSEIDRASREASLDLSKSFQHERSPSQPSGSTEVPDDLRAKIRAMLMATL